MNQIKQYEDAIATADWREICHSWYECHVKLWCRWKWPYTRVNSSVGGSCRWDLLLCWIALDCAGVSNKLVTVKVRELTGLLINTDKYHTKWLHFCFLKPKVCPKFTMTCASLPTNSYILYSCSNMNSNLDLCYFCHLQARITFTRLWCFQKVTS